MMTSFTCGLLVSRISLRLVSGSSSGTMPACGQQRQGLLEDAPLGQGDGERGVEVHGVAALLRTTRAGSVAPRAGELGLDGLVAAVEVVDAVDQGLALGHQARQHQAGGGAQVGGHDRGGGQALDPAADGEVALEADVGAHALEFLDVHEAVLEDGLGDRADPLGHAVQGAELGLHVGGEGRVGGGVDVHRLRAPAPHVELDPVRPGLDLGAGLAQLLQHRSRGSPGGCR